MARVPLRPFLILTALIVVSLSAIAFRLHANKPSDASSEARAKPAASAPPNLILWAWERPEDLSFIDPQKTGVAYLAKTIFLRGDSIATKPRLQPLSVPSGTTVIPVVRIEIDREEAPTLSARQANDAAFEISKLASLRNAATVQIDFDATASQRNFYRALLVELRRKLPATTRLSITALGSWCQGDNWLGDLPIDEAVPMLFRMGIDRNAILSRLAGEGLQGARCESSAGVSTDEQIADLPPVSRLYVFNPNRWDRASVNKLVETYHR